MTKVKPVMISKSVSEDSISVKTRKPQQSIRFQLHPDVEPIQQVEVEIQTKQL